MRGDFNFRFQERSIDLVAVAVDILHLIPHLDVLDLDDINVHRYVELKYAIKNGKRVFFVTDFL